MKKKLHRWMALAVVVLGTACQEQRVTHVSLVKMGEDPSKEGHWWKTVEPSLGGLLEKEQSKLRVIEGSREVEFRLTEIKEVISVTDFEPRQERRLLEEFQGPFSSFVGVDLLSRELERARQAGKTVVVVSGLPSLQGESPQGESAWYSSQGARIPRLGALLLAQDDHPADDALPLAAGYSAEAPSETSRIPVYWIFQASELSSLLGVEENSSAFRKARNQLEKLWKLSLDSMGGSLRSFGSGSIVVNESDFQASSEIATLRIEAEQDRDEILREYPNLETRRRVVTLTRSFKPAVVPQKRARPESELNPKRLRRVWLTWDDPAELNLVLKNDGRRTDLFRDEVPDVLFTEDLSIGEGGVDIEQAVQFFAERDGVARSPLNEFYVHFTEGEVIIPPRFTLHWEWEFGQVGKRDYQFSSLQGGGYDHFEEKSSEKDPLWTLIELNPTPIRNTITP